MLGDSGKVHRQADIQEVTSRFSPCFLFSPNQLTLKRGEQLLEVRTEWQANSNHISDSSHPANLKHGAAVARDAGTGAPAELSSSLQVLQCDKVLTPGVLPRPRCHRCRSAVLLLGQHRASSSHCPSTVRIHLIHLGSNTSRP